MTRALRVSADQGHAILGGTKRIHYLPAPSPEAVCPHKPGDLLKTPAQQVESDLQKGAPAARKRSGADTEGVTSMRFEGTGRFCPACGASIVRKRYESGLEKPAQFLRRETCGLVCGRILLARRKLVQARRLISFVEIDGQRTLRVPLFDHAGRIKSHALVDVADLDLVRAHRWHQVGGYVVRSGGEQVGKGVLHRDILGLRPHSEERLVADHINGNGLDNRRSNLRVATGGENQQNRRRPWGSSKYRGVSWDSYNRRWRADVQVGGRPFRLGSFKDEESAARVAADFRAEHMPFSADALREAEAA